MMKPFKASIAALFSVGITAATAFGDAEFKYVDGRCVNEKGETGLNPKIIGDCGDLREMNLEKMDLAGMSLRGANLARANLTDAVLNRADLSDAKAMGAEMSRSKFNGADFYSADLTGANLTGTEATLADFSFAVMAGATLTGAKYSAVHFFQTDLTRTVGVKPAIRKSVIAESDFSDSKFESADFIEGQFSDSKLDRAEWVKASLSSTLIRGVSLEKTRFDGSDFRAARIEDCGLAETSFLDADLRLARLQDAGWESAILRGAKINSSTLHPFSDAEIAKAGIIKILKKRELGFFNDGRFVDNGSGSGSEATNLQKIFGKDIVLTTETFTPENFAVDLDAIGTYMLPEMERGRLPIEGEGAVVSALQAFLADGGNLVTFSGSNLQLIGAITGTPVSSSDLGSYPLAEDVAKDMGFSDLPSELLPQNGTDGVTLSSLPPGSKALLGSAAAGGVAMIPYGKGRIWYFGWDFFGFSAEDPRMMNWSKTVEAVLKKTME